MLLKFHFLMELKLPLSKRNDLLCLFRKTSWKVRVTSAVNCLLDLLTKYGQLTFKIMITWKVRYIRLYQQIFASKALISKTGDLRESHGTWCALTFIDPWHHRWLVNRVLPLWGVRRPKRRDSPKSSCKQLKSLLFPKEFLKQMLTPSPHQSQQTKCM